MALGSSFGQTFFISIFAAEIMAEFDLGPGAWGAIYAFGTSSAAAAMVWAGALADRVRARDLVTWVLCGLACACLLMAANRVWLLLPVTVFALRFLGQGMMSHVALTAISRWFQARRGRALAVATLGFALGEAFLPVAAVSARAWLDWRTLWVVAALAAVALIPVLRRLLARERRPGGAAEARQAAGLGGDHWTRARVLGTPLCLLLIPAFTLPGAFVTAFFFHQVALARELGLSHLTFVALFPLYTGVAVTATLASGWAIDRIGSLRLMPLYQVPLALGFAAMAAGDGALALGAMLVLMGIATGANATLPTAFLAEAFGTRHLGGIKAVALAAMVLGSALGPLATGIAMEAGFAFREQGPVLAAAILLGCAATGIAVARLRGGYV